MYLGGVEVQVILLLIGCQILVLVVGSGSYQHHPVAVFLTARVKTHDHAIPLEDLLIEGLTINQKGSQDKKEQNYYVY